MHKTILFLVAMAFPIAACSVEDNQVDKAAQVSAPAAEAATGAAPVAARVAQADPAVSQTRPTPQAAPAGAFVEGKDYRLLTPTQPTSSSPDQIEVAEVFMPSCIHCFRFEPFIKDFVANAPEGVNFVRIPASFNPMARLHTRAFYAIETMGMEDKLVEPMFTEFHVNKNHLETEAKLKAFVEQHGVDGDKFLSTMNSFAVDTKVRKADTLARRYQITSVPTIVINGKYVTQASMTGSVERLRDVIDYLVAQEARAN